MPELSSRGRNLAPMRCLRRKKWSKQLHSTRAVGRSGKSIDTGVWFSVDGDLVSRVNDWLSAQEAVLIYVSVRAP